LRNGKKISATQLQRFLAHIDAVAEQLRPARRARDRDAPECSPREFAFRAIGEQQRITMTNIASTIGVTLSTATHTINSLVDKGFVERVQDQRDRRVVHVKFSRKGRNIHRYVVESRRVLSQSILERLDPGSLTLFLEALEAIAGAPAVPHGRQ
jgi:DNA-binding MarR family transcriptional regulator